MRLVLDTNILVSIYLFADVRHVHLRSRCTMGEGELLMDAVCYEEAAHVLRSSRFEAARASRAVDAEAALRALADDATWIASKVPPMMPALPQCSDPSDQKFLTLAARGSATHLITYDKALLKCRHRAPFVITRPEAFASHL
jgi:uncharacterized protein